MEQDIITSVVLAALVLAAGLALIAGINKTIDIQERTYYDKELGRTVYVEKGV
jgi:hypothetical protein